MKHQIRIKRRDGIRQRYWVGKKIPQGVGTLWHGDKFIHGPRVTKPSNFTDQRIYIVNQDWAKNRHLMIPKSIPDRIQKFAKKEKLLLPKNYKTQMRLKVGTLKQTKKLGVQSFITPIIEVN